MTTAPGCQWLLCRLHREWLRQPAEFASLSDAQLLRDIHPDLRQLDVPAHDLFHLSFALRHIAVQLAGALDFLAIAGPSPAASQATREDFLRAHPLGHQICKELESGLSEFVASTFPGPLPVIGFSAQGLHFCMRHVGICRAFDRYEQVSCANPLPANSSAGTAAPLCEDHRHWNPWSGGNEAVFSETTGGLARERRTLPAQTHMFRFYADLRNAESMTPECLEELMAGFWQRYVRFVRTVGDAPIEAALRDLAYPSLDALRSGGRAELMHRYRQRARAAHPDAGGSHEEFVRLADCLALLEPLCE